MSKFMSNSYAPEVDEFDLDEEELLPEDVLGEDEASLSGLDYVDEDDDDGLGYVGLGRARKGRKSRRRRSRRSRGRARRAKAGRRRRRRSRKSRARGRARRVRSHRRRRHRRVRVAAAAPKRRRRRSNRRRKSAAKAIVQMTVPKVRRHRRRKAGARRRRLSGVGTHGFGRALGKLADTVALQSLSGLGKAGRKRRKSRRRKGMSRRRHRAARSHRRSRRAHRRARAHRRSGRHRRSRRMGGLGLGSLFRGFGAIGNMHSGLADSIVSSSTPVIGPFKYAISMPGLEALGGVALAPVVTAVAQKIVSKIPWLNAPATGIMGLIKRFATPAISAIGIWELGRLLGSGNLGTFGAFYTFGKFLETELIQPYVIKNIPGLSGYGMYGLGQAQIPDGQELRDLSYLGQKRVPTSTEFDGMGQRIVTEEELLGETVGEDDSEDSNVF